MPDFSTVTETPQDKGSQEQISMLFTRYQWAAGFCKDKKVLEVGCGAGQGLGLLAKSASLVIGGDIEPANLKFAQRHYDGRDKIKLLLFDGHKFPLKDKSIDVVILYEAIYYLSEPEKFIQEALRVLKDKGVLLICTVNCSWPDFNPSPFSTKYFSVPELYQMLKTKFPTVEIYGAFPALADSAKTRLVSFIKRTAVSLHLIPKTMKGKKLLKRLFFGQLIPIPAEIEENGYHYQMPTLIPYNSPNSTYKVTYAVARI